VTDQRRSEQRRLADQATPSQRIVGSSPTRRPDSRTSQPYQPAEGVLSRDRTSRLVSGNLERGAAWQWDGEHDPRLRPVVASRCLCSRRALPAPPADEMREPISPVAPSYRRLRNPQCSRSPSGFVGRFLRASSVRWSSVTSRRSPSSSSSYESERFSGRPRRSGFSSGIDRC
jgi:hypothetical protein